MAPGPIGSLGAAGAGGGASAGAVVSAETGIGLLEETLPQRISPPTKTTATTAPSTIKMIFGCAACDTGAAATSREDSSAGAAEASGLARSGCGSTPGMDGGRGVGRVRI